MIRYSNRSFFAIMDTISPPISFISLGNVTDFDKFQNLLFKTLNDLTAGMLSNVSNHMFATEEVNVSSSLNLHALVQCTPDLLVEDCELCLYRSIYSWYFL